MQLKLVELTKDQTTTGTNHGYSVADTSKRTMPVYLGYMEYNERTGTWFVFRQRTQEYIYRTMPKLLQPEDMQWLHKVFSKRYRNGTGYNVPACG